MIYKTSRTRGQVRLSYDYLPGFVDQQQHLPNAYGEPAYYAWMDAFVAGLGRAFPNVKHLHLAHDEIRGMVSGSIDSKTIKQQAVSNGMGTLRTDGARKVLSGITSIAEVLRATEEEGTVAQI